MQHNWKYMILIIFSAAILLLLVRFARTQSGDYRTKKDIEHLIKSKDSLFVLADRVVDSVEEDKKIKEIQIDSLKHRLANQKEIIKTKTVFVESTSEEKNKVMAVGFDVRGMEQELERRQQIIEQLSRINSRLNHDLDSLQSIIDKK